MKDLHVLKTLLLLCSLGAALIAADEHNVTLSEEYLSKPKRQQLSLEQEKIDAETTNLRDSWIMPIKLQYTYNKSDPYGSEQTNKNFVVSIDQPIFKSGGIVYGIKYAGASHRYATDNLEQQRRQLIKEAVAFLMQIRQSDLLVAKQELLISNAKINLDQKREQYLNGQIDSGFLNTALLEANAATQALYDIQSNRERLVSAFKRLSDLDPETAPLPTLQLLDEAAFMRHNVDIQAQQSEAKMQRYNKMITYAKYMPQLNVMASFNKEETEGLSLGGSFTIPDSETTYRSYGFRASMSLDYNSISDVEAARVEQLKSEVLLVDTKRDQLALYEQVSQNLKNYDRKIELAQSNQQLYRELLKETKELFSAGYKTEFDVENMHNSVEIQQLDTQIFELDKQLELLNLYEKLSNAADGRES